MLPHRAQPQPGPARCVALELLLHPVEMFCYFARTEVVVQPVPSGLGCPGSEQGLLLTGSLYPPAPLGAPAPHRMARPNPSHGRGKRASHGGTQLALRLPFVQGFSVSHDSTGRAQGWQWGGAGGTSELLIGSILALSPATQTTSAERRLWGPVRWKGEGAPSSSDLPNLTRPFLLPLRPRPSGSGSVGR